MSNVDLFMKVAIVVVMIDQINACTPTTYVQCRSKTSSKIACVQTKNGKCSPKSVWEDFQLTPSYSTLRDCKATLCDPAIDCSNNGVCVAGGSCDCNDNFYGDACDVNCDPAVNCMGNKTCTATGDCICSDNYFGADCDVFCTSADTCSNHGTCNSDGACTCSENYFTEDCSVYCSDSDTCHGHGTCNMTTWRCDCDEGFTGEFCGNYFVHPKVYLYYSRAQAEADCQAVGAQLAEIRGERDIEAASQVIFQLAYETLVVPYLWIGLRRDQASGEMKWTSSQETQDFGTVQCEGESSPESSGRSSKLQSSYSSVIDELKNLISTNQVPNRFLSPRAVDPNTGTCDCAVITFVDGVINENFLGRACSMSNLAIERNIFNVGYALCQTFAATVPVADPYNGSATFFPVPLGGPIADFVDYADSYFNNTICSVAQPGASVPLFKTEERLSQLLTISTSALLLSQVSNPIFLIGLVSEDSTETWHWIDNTPLDTSSWLNSALEFDYDSETELNQTDIRFCGIFFVIFIMAIPCDYDFVELGNSLGNAITNGLCEY